MPTIVKVYIYYGLKRGDVYFELVLNGVNVNDAYGVKALSCFSPSSLLEAPPHLIFSLQVSTNDMLSSSAFLHAENSKQFRIECNKC